MASELEAYLALRREIDTLARRSREAQAQASEFYEMYREPLGNVAWTRQLDDWLKAQGSEGPLAVDDALEFVADNADLSTTAKAKRLRALSALVTLAPALYGVDGEHAAEVRGALRPLTRDGDSADHLHQVLTERIGPLGFHQTIAYHGDLLFAYAHAALTHIRCNGTLQYVTLGGELKPVVVMTTSATASGIPLSVVASHMRPENWPHCSDFWIEMKKLSDQPLTFEEHVGFKPGPALVRACLQFHIASAKGQESVEYKMCDTTNVPTDVSVDEGSILAQESGVDAVTVTTTKRVRFEGMFDGVALAETACALGYGHIGADLLFNCALDESLNSGSNPVIVPHTPPKKAPIGVLPSGADPVDVANEAAKAFAECAASTAEAYNASMQKAISGAYTADDMANDIAQFWGRLAKDTALAMSWATKLAYGTPPDDKKP